MRFSDVVTTGNILTVLGVAGTLGTGMIALYWKLRQYWDSEQAKYEERINRRLQEHANHIENCIHRLPGHPENVAAVENFPHEKY